MEAQRFGGLEAWSLDAWMHGSLELPAWEKQANTLSVHRFLTRLAKHLCQEPCSSTFVFRIDYHAHILGLRCDLKGW